MSLLVLLLFIAPALLGTAVTIIFRAAPEKVTTILMGATLGLASFTTAMYVLTLVIPLSPALLWIICAGLLAGTALLAPQAWSLWRRLPFDRLALILLVILTIIFSNISLKLLFTQDDGLYTGIINAYGDVAWHAANITTFAEGQVTPPENPIFSGTRLTYPFMINFFSALLLVGGASLAESITIPALVLIPLLLVLFYALVHTLTGTKTAAIVTMLLFLLGGATFGWTRIVSDWRESETSALGFITHLPNLDYSGVGVDPNGFHFLNPVTSLLLPQRSLLIGFPLAFCLLLILAPSHERPLTRTAYLLAGLMAGIIPLFHAHTTLALVPALLGFFAFDLKSNWTRRRETLTNWGLFALVALIIGLPEVAYYVRGTNTAEGAFWRWGPRWLAGDRNIVWYWFINTGLFIPLTIVGLFTRAPARLKILAGAGLLLFVIANLWLFAPWAWDNFKLFVYFFLFCLPLVGYVIAQHLTRQTSRVVVGLIAILVGIHILSAALDLWKISLPTAAAWMEWQTDEVAFADQIKAVTKPGESIVTAANHNSPVVLAGRPRYLGYAAHAWSHGLDPWQREAALKEFYAGRLLVLPEDTPDYVFVGRAERGTYPQLVIQPTWQLVAQSGPLALYKLPH